MKHPAGWYTQPDGEKLYWDGQKYSAAWAEGTGAVPHSEVDTVLSLGLGSSTETMSARPLSGSQTAAKGFFASLFDFGFTSFITLKLLSFVYGLLVVLILLAGVAGLFVGISRGGMNLVIAIVGIPIGTLIYLVMIRVSMEMVALFFRIGQNTNLMAASARDAGIALEAVDPLRV